ncbi:MAG: hypothetical protein U0136_13405 [Bdellovibrionota bacterium]
MKSTINCWRTKVQQAGTVQKFVAKHQPDVDALVDAFTAGISSSAKATAGRYATNILKVLEAENDLEMLVVVLNALEYAIASDRDAPSARGAAQRFGFRLADFLMRIGGAKLAQALHSYDETPSAWKVGLGRSKDAVEAMSDEDFTAEARRQLPSAMLSALDSGDLVIGEHIGAGAYLDTRALAISVDYRRGNRLYRGVPDDAEFVLQLVKPQAPERARKVYDVTLRLLGMQESGKRVAAIGAEALVLIIEHYRDMLDEETNLEAARDKAAQLSRMAKQFTISLEDNTALVRVVGKPKQASIRFQAAGMFEAGPRFRVSTRMKGVHFKDMPQRTADEKLVKFFVAIACFMRHLRFLLSGKPFNHDPHAANLRAVVVTNSSSLVEIVVGEFDELGICRAPTERQMRIFGDMLMDAVGCALHYGIDLNETIKEAFSIVAVRMRRGDDKVHSMLKTLMTISDYQSYIDWYTGNPLTNAAVYLQMLQGLAASDSVHPTLREVFGTRFAAIQLLLKPKSATTAEARALLLSEQTRVNEWYPMNTSLTGLATLMKLAQGVVFKRAASNAERKTMKKYRFIPAEA